MSKQYPPQQLHLPVLLDETLRVLSPQPGESYLDLTAGYGGHASSVLKQTGAYNTSVLVDRDQLAIASLTDFKQKGARLLHCDFVSAAQILLKERSLFDVVCVDLGVSSPQLDTAERGFSFRLDAHLDMRMDNRQEKSAADIVNTWDKQALSDLIRTYGEESAQVANRYAQAIVSQRPLQTTAELAQCILESHRGRRQKIHPATRTFQALRIATNDEIGQLETLLPLLPQLLQKGGRVAIISFHSLEDRLVKKFFQSEFTAGYEARLRPILKKPILGSNELVYNPRARSAKLRAAEKI